MQIMTRTVWMAAIAGLGLAVAGVAAWSQASGGAPEFRGNVGPFALTAEPRATPEISFTDAADKKLTLADFKGRVVLLNFWATWCAPCVEEMPALDRLQAAKGSADFMVLALALDRQGKPLVEPFLQKLAVKSLPMYIDASSAAMRAFNLRGLPTTILLDRDGRELGRLEGPAKWDSPEAAAFLQHFIDPKSPPKGS
jgi:thiol-disulfide isomerase/thioredoxin